MGHALIIILWWLSSWLCTTDKDMHKMMCDEAEEMYREGRI